MLSTLKQLILQWFLLTNITPTHEVTIKLKRAPLEIGLISFGTNPVKNFHSDFLNQTTSIGAVEEPLNLPSKVALHSRHIWIPGHVHRQSFIPAHIHHVLVSSHSQLLLAQHLHTTLLLKPSEKQLKVYNELSPVGGFGVGYDFGGTGAGHGFQVSF